MTDSSPPQTQETREIPRSSLDDAIGQAVQKSANKGVKHFNQLAYILHSKPYSETSLMLEVFTREHGRLCIVAKGAKRPYTQWRASLFQTFQTLSIGFSGKGLVRTLIDVEWIGGIPLLEGGALMSGYYLNEWMMRCLARDQPTPPVFDLYQTTLAKLSFAAPAEFAQILRHFEWQLLVLLGFAPDFEKVLAIEGFSPDGYYDLMLLRQNWRASEANQASAQIGQMMVTVSGGAILGLLAQHFEERSHIAQMRVLLQSLLHHHLGAEPLQTQLILQELNRSKFVVT